MKRDSIASIAGLPEELGIDEDFARSQETLHLRMERRRYGKPVTIVEGIDTDLTDLKAFASKLKRALGAGGTVEDGTVIIQGDHRERLRKLLEEDGYTVE